jgi:hypothetical protein
MAYGARSMKTYTQKVFIALYSTIGLILLILTGALAYEYSVFKAYVHDLDVLKQEYRFYIADLQQYMSQAIYADTSIDEKKK